MNQITQIGASIEEAISLALQKLGVSRDQVDVEVLQEGRKGFLGFGARPAEIRVTVKEIDSNIEENSDFQQVKSEKIGQEVFVENIESINEIVNEEEKEDPVEAAKGYLIGIAKELGIEDLKIQAVSEGKNILLKLESEKAALLIGKRGATLNALQQLTQLIVNKSAKSFLLVKLDVENYRERRQVALEQLAERMADKAVHTGKKISLEPMPSYERKVIHNALANRIDIETYSEGTEPNRYLVIEPLK